MSSSQEPSTRTIEFDTDEGTRMSLDVSPDSKTIVFDLLGQLYVLPIIGGTAKRIPRATVSTASPGMARMEDCVCRGELTTQPS